MACRLNDRKKAGIVYVTNNINVKISAKMETTAILIILNLALGDYGVCSFGGNLTTVCVWLST